MRSGQYKCYGTIVSGAKGFYFLVEFFKREPIRKKSKESSFARGSHSQSYMERPRATANIFNGILRGWKRRLKRASQKDGSSAVIVRRQAGMIDVPEHYLGELGNTGHWIAS